MGWVSANFRKFPAIPARGWHRGPGGMRRGLFGLQPPVAMLVCSPVRPPIFTRRSPGGCEGSFLTQLSVLRAGMVLLFRPCLQAARGLVSRPLRLWPVHQHSRDKCGRLYRLSCADFPEFHEGGALMKFVPFSAGRGFYQPAKKLPPLPGPSTAPARGRRASLSIHDQTTDESDHEFEFNC